MMRTAALLFAFWVTTLCFPVLSLGGSYKISAHGDPVYGVKRTQGPTHVPYAFCAGNCSHCHEQHASIAGGQPSPVNSEASPFGLFAPTFDTTQTLAPYQQSDLLCFYCHTDSASYQAAPASMVNYDYAHTFAGMPGGVSSIMAQFNQGGSAGGSNHNLYDLWTYCKNNFNRNSGGYFTEMSDPCTGCHNPHLARRNKENRRDAGYATISRPTEHDDQWGDDPDEQMFDYTSSFGIVYQAPLYYGSSTTYEPDGVADGVGLDDGSLTPDYNSFCNDCHGESAPAVYSTPLGRNLDVIPWGGAGGDITAAGDKHGANKYTEDVVSRPPYDQYAEHPNGYILSCMDCHEPHGSPNAYLIRRSINGEALGDTIDSGKDGSARGNQCRQCHKDDYAAGGNLNTALINVWKTTHHGGGMATDNPYTSSQVSGCGCHQIVGNKKLPIPCENCHYHGGHVPDPANAFPGDVRPARSNGLCSDVANPDCWIRKTF